MSSEVHAQSEREPLLPSSAPVTTDDLDTRLHRWKEAVKKMSKGKQRAKDEAEWLVSVFQDTDQISSTYSSDAVKRGDSELAADVYAVKQAIEQGVLPQMIQTGSSGSYFAKSCDTATGQRQIRGIFKPADEEPYGNLNPKRAFLRRYFWWAMGRPCLIPGFSAMSEAGASLLDGCLDLGMVPTTRLVHISSPSFHYAYNDRKAYDDHGRNLPDKMGSFQAFLKGYVMVSTFLRRNPLPSRPRSLLEQDLADEQRAHRKSRKREKARLRSCGVRLKYLLLCRRPSSRAAPGEANAIDTSSLRADEDRRLLEEESGFLWAPQLVDSFRSELEKLVIFDYLCRNTDRGLDNFMIQHTRGKNKDGSGDTVKLGAIDNSLAWPIKHPDGIRDYPYGWLYLPASLIGGPFSQATRDHFLPKLSSAQWWLDTQNALHDLFAQEEHFNRKLFESQMAVFKGQGWNVVQSLKTVDEGPLELCARQKKIVRQSVEVLLEHEVEEFTGAKLPLGSSRTVPSYGGNASAAVPIPIGPGSTSEAVPQIMNGAQPRSLPETSALTLRQAAPLASPELASPPAIGTSLGIDVLKDLDKAAKTRKRPAYAKALSGFDISRQNREVHKAYLPRRPPAHARSRSDAYSESSEALAAASDDGDRDSIDSYDADAASRMVQSDYFASYGGRSQHHQHHQQQAVMPSIDGLLAGGADSPTKLGRGPPASAADGKAAVSSLRQTLEANQQKDVILENGTHSPALDVRPRRKRSSTGQWSISSLGLGSGGNRSSKNHARKGTVAGRDGKRERKIKVIVERLIDDRSMPWQAWLRA